jgi:uncharacterized protein YjbI with pentapeptide repeats
MTKAEILEALKFDIKTYLLKPLWKWVSVPLYHLSGAALIIDKLSWNADKDKFSTLFIWVLGIYVSIFGLATQHYESRLDRFENTLNIYVAQLGTSARNATFSALVAHQSYSLPVEPSFWSPFLTAKTLIGGSVQIDQEATHSGKVKRIAAMIVRFKGVLGCKAKDTKASCTRVNLQGANLVRANLARANLEGVNLDEVNLKGANLQRADLLNTGLFKTNLRNADLRNANLQEADFERAYASGVDFSEADLRWTDLRRTYFVWADLRKADLFMANLHSTSLHGASLIGAKLRKAELSGADLSEADLKMADLREALNLDCEQLKEAENWQLAYRDERLACGASIPVKEY